MTPSPSELERRFRFQSPPNEARRVAHELVSELTLNLARTLVDICPEGGQLSLCLTNLEAVRMRANAALATQSTDRTDADLEEMLDSMQALLATSPQE